MGIYLDNQASTPLDPRVFGTMSEILREECGNPHSGEHAWGWAASKRVDEAAQAIKDCLGAPDHVVVFTSGASEANNLALKGLAGALAAVGRPGIAHTAIEHKCIIATAESLDTRTQATVHVIPVDRTGQVELDTLRNLLAAESIGLVSVQAVNNEIGTIQPVADIARMVHEAGALFHSDCAQAPYAIECGDLGEQCDLITISGHKIYGPQGIGALLIREDIADSVEPIIHGGGQQAGIRSGTLPTFLCAGLGAAISICREDGPEEREFVSRKRDRLFDKLKSAAPELELNGPPLGNRHPGNINVRFDGVCAADLIQRAQPDLAISTGSACTSGEVEPSYVLTAAGLSRKEAEASIRLSVGRFTTDADIDGAATILSNIIRG